MLRVPPPKARTSTGIPTWISFSVFTVLMGGLSLLRYETCHSRSLDMAYYVRLVWGMAHGTYDQPVVGAPHILGLHLEPVLVPFALAARLGVPIAELLLVAQAAMAGAVIFPATALSKRRLGPILGEKWAHAAALAIYLIPTVTRCVDYDFHPSTMVIWPLLAMVNALDAGQMRRAAAWFLFALTFREDVGLQGAAAGLTIAVRPPGRTPGERAWGLALGGIGLAWFFGYCLGIQPHFLPDARTGSFGAHFSHFGGGEGGVGGVLRAALSQPGHLLKYLVSGDRPLYPLLLLVQVGFLPLLAPRWLAGALPLVAINVLSDYPGMRSMQAHYITAAVPFIAASATCGAARLALWLKGKKTLSPTLLLAATAMAWALRGASPWSPEWRTSAYVSDDQSRLCRSLVASTPKDAEVVAPSAILAHLACRPVARRGTQYAVSSQRGEPP
ncbi:MAG: DUF2079 domain-containing protein [Deltaproteobacteria bacterium]|nr:DUF2079 domain-containing protein [Deltaproteobacteria bacterium]